MHTNLEAPTVDDNRGKRMEIFSQANTGLSEKLELTSRGIEMLQQLNDAFDNDLDD